MICSEIRLATTFDFSDIPRQQQARLSQKAVYCYPVPAGNLLLSGNSQHSVLLLHVFSNFACLRAYHLHLQAVGQEIIEPETKSCSVCLRSRPVTEYWKRAASRDGLQLICKDCQKSLVARLKESRKDWPQYNGQLECATCETLKPVEDFNKCVGTVHGWQYVCRACSTQRLRSNYSRSKELHQCMSGQHKFCRRCQLEKPTDQFYRNAGHTDGLQSFCKLCMLAEDMRRRSRRKV